MRQLSKKIGNLCLVVLLALSVSCKKQIETMTLGAWISEIVNEMQLPEAIQSKPYYLNISESHERYEVIQAAVEWGVINPSTSQIEPNEKLSKEWVAYTLTNLMNVEKSSLKVKDSGKSLFPDEIAKAVNVGLFQLDSRGCFSPKSQISKEEALNKLQMVKSYVNNYEVDTPTFEVEFDDDIKEVEVPIDFYEEEEVAIFSKNTSLEKGDIIRWVSDKEYFYKVNEVENQEDKVIVGLTEADYDDVFNEVELEGSFDIDFNEAEITPLLDEISIADDLSIQKVLSKEIVYKDFRGVVSAGSQGINVKIEKENLVAEFKLYKVKPVVRWKSSDDNLNDAYFKINYSTTESIKLEEKKIGNMYSDFSFLKGKNFINQLINSFKTSEDMEGTTIPICNITVPIPNVPLLTLTMQLKLHFYTSGKVELILANDHQFGLEIKNNKLRTFNDSKRDMDFIMKASTSSTVGLTTGVSAGNISLMDFMIRGGIRGFIDTIVHVYDKNGNKDENKVNVSLIDADNAAISNNDVKVCGNINLHWLAELTVNTSKTMASKFGFSKTLNLMNENNSKIILDGKTHIENWQFMKKCTRKHRLTTSTSEPINSDKIVIDKMNMVVDLKEVKKIQIVALPKGYTLSDLIFSSNKTDVCKVASDGSISPLQRGSAIITIMTKDSKYKTHCNILVTNKDKDESANT